MKRIIVTLISLAVVIAVLLSLPFTPPGNRLLAGMLQQKLHETSGLPVQVEQFSLGLRHFSLTILLGGTDRIEAGGEYALFAQSLSARYTVTLHDLAALSAQKLHGSLRTEGTVEGTAAQLQIKGHTDLAGSDTGYRLDLHEFSPGALTATVRHARLEQLLALVGEEALGSGSIDADILLNSLDPAALDGTLDATLSDGTLDRALIKKRYGTQLPDTALEARLQAKLQGDTVTYDAKTDSALGHLDSAGTLRPQAGGMDLRYAFSIKELALLQGLTGHALHGPIALSGTLKGDREHLDATAAGDLAGGHADLKAVLKAFAPVSADLSAEHLRLAKLLTMLGYPRAADADITARALLQNLQLGALKGSVTVAAAKGSIDKAVLSKLTGRTFPAGTFTFQSTSRLEGDLVKTAADLGGDLLTLHTDTLLYDVKQQRLSAGYTATFPDLRKLSTLAERSLRGTAKITGDLTYSDHLLLHANSNLFDGAIASTLNGQALQATFKKIKTVQAMHMLSYPETFDARFDGTLDYALDTKRGELKGALTEGAFTRNTVFDLLRRYTTVDLYRERFKGDTLVRLDDKKIDADVQLHSGHTALRTSHAKIDTAADTVLADVKLETSGSVIPFRLKGKLSHPGVTVDAGKLIEREAGKQIQQIFDSFLK